MADCENPRFARMPGDALHILESFPLINSTGYKVVLACRSEAKAGLKLAMLKTERANAQASFLQLDLARCELSIEDFRSL